MNLHESTIQMIKKLAGNEYLYFPSPVQVRLSPHTHPFAAQATCVSPEGVLFVMSYDEQGREDWNELIPGIGNADMVIASLYQRLTIYSSLKAAV